MSLKKKLAWLTSSVMLATSVFSALTVSSDETDLKIKGDITRDNDVTVADLVALNHCIVKKAFLEENDLYYADINNDNVVNVFDTVLLRKTVLGERKITGKNSLTITVIDSITRDPIPDITVELQINPTGSSQAVEIWNTTNESIKTVDGLLSNCFYGVYYAVPSGYTNSSQSNIISFTDDNVNHYDITIELTPENTNPTETPTEEPTESPTEEPTDIVTDVPITTTTIEELDLSDMPEEYTSALDWVWENRISAENSTARWNTIFDQIVAGEGTLNYVVRWQSYKTVTYEQRQQFEDMIETSVNGWTDYLVGYDDWKYDHIDVNVVGWAVIDESCILDKHDDEIIYTNCTPYDSQYDTSNGREEIPNQLPNAPDELSRMYHFDTNSGYDYPGGLDKRFDMYMWATQGFPDIGGCGGDWGQRLSDDAYLNMLNGSNIHVFEHELGHGFGITDFYGGEGESDGFPPGGFPENTIMMAGNSDKITNYDGWQLRYIWSQIKDQTDNSGTARFN